VAKRQVTPRTRAIWGGMWHVQYENKVGTIERIHSLNLQGENNPKGAKKPSQKDHLLIKVACV